MLRELKFQRLKNEGIFPNVNSQTFYMGHTLLHLPKVSTNKCIPKI